MTSNQQEEIVNLTNYYDIALKLIMQCGPIFQEGFRSTFTNFEEKTAYYDLVTVYDKLIEDFLIKGLSKAFPESKFIGEEETGCNKVGTELTDDPTWIIDPIDGTTNFINKFSQCCISVGLAINKELMMGIIYNPIVNEIYSARKGYGAYLNGERINVSKVNTIKSAIVGYEMSLIQVPQIRDKHIKRLCKLASCSSGIIGIGSAALNLCYVAKGCFQSFHVEDLKPWDIAAGAIILTEAGGFIKQTNGGPFNVMKPDLICACTKELLNEVKSVIAEADQITEYNFDKV